MSGVCVQEVAPSTMQLQLCCVVLHNVHTVSKDRLNSALTEGLPNLNLSVGGTRLSSLLPMNHL
jgi:hypothetical protein